MTFRKRNMIGMTLVETILALVIATSIIMMGFRLYLTYQSDAAAQQVRYNAEEIIRSAAMYYYANCQKSDANTTATLDPDNSPANPYTNLKVSDLISSGYLMKAPPLSPLVNSTDANTKGYLIQFNMFTNPRKNCTTPGDPTTCDQIGVNVNYNIQVSVLLKNESLGKRYLNMTGATCLTTANGTNKVVSCTQAATFEANCKLMRDPTSPSYNPTLANTNNCPVLGGTYGNYLSWERLPSMSSQQGQSVMWSTNPMTMQFKQRNELKNSLSYMYANPTATNFLCGS